jgi:uncharacterized protein (TIGR02285 family)
MLSPMFRRLPLAPRRPLSGLARGLVAALAFLPLASAHAGRPAVTFPIGEVTWLTPESDPTPTPDAPAQTLAQPMADYLMQQWRGASHQQVMVVNFKRAWRMIETGERVCHVGALHTKARERVAVFVDTHMTPPPLLVVRQSALDRLPGGDKGEVRLSDVWRASALRGAIVQGRSYGQQLDPLLAHHPDKARIDEYTVRDFGGGLLAMVSAGRADYTLDYDFMLQKQLRAPLPGGEGLVGLPLAEASEPLVSGIACPRNEWGRRVAASLRQFLNTPASRQVMKQRLNEMLTTDDRQRYGARIERFYARP